MLASNTPSMPNMTISGHSQASSRALLGIISLIFKKTGIRTSMPKGRMAFFHFPFFRQASSRNRIPAASAHPAQPYAA